MPTSLQAPPASPQPSRDSSRIRCGHFTWPRGERTLIMGILNVTPDSFSGDAVFHDVARAVERAHEMIEEGADLIDLGGESTRPGAEPVTESEEMERILPVLERLVASGIPVSVDTAKPNVAAEAVKHGACLLNDVTGLRDERMAAIVASSDVGIVVMHMQGTPRTMQNNPVYGDVVQEVDALLVESSRQLEAQGVTGERIFVDPGLGFGKNLEHNLLLLRHLDRLVQTGYPVLIGPSRKSFLGALTGKPVEERRFGTAACVAVGIAQGAAMVRVHDVKEMRDVVRVTDAIVRGHQAA